jgi:hypothetical protein
VGGDQQKRLAGARRAGDGDHDRDDRAIRVTRRERFDELKLGMSLVTIVGVFGYLPVPAAPPSTAGIAVPSRSWRLAV